MVVVAAVGYEATLLPHERISWRVATAPPGRLNAESLIPTPTGFSILAGPGSSGGIVWSTADGGVWLSRTLPELASRIVYHPRGLFVIDRRALFRVGPDGDDGIERLDVSEAIRIGNGSKRTGLVAALDGLIAQTVGGDVLWSADARSFELAVEASIWGADSDVTPRPPDVSDIAPERVRSSCRPRAKRAPDVPPFLSVEGRLVAMLPEHDPSVVWPICEPVLWISADGKDWVRTTDTSPFGEGAYVFDLAWRDGLFVAVGGIGYNTPMVWTSPDGSSWEPFDRLVWPDEIDLTDVEAGAVGWVVVGVPRNGSRRVGWFSPDGACWEPLPEGVAGRGVSVGDDLIMSVDGDPPVVWVGTPTRPLITWQRCL